MASVSKLVCMALTRGVGRILNRGLLYRLRACARQNFYKLRPQTAHNGAFCACAYHAVPNIRCSNIIVIAISSIAKTSKQVKLKFQ